MQLEQDLNFRVHKIGHAQIMLHALGSRSLKSLQVKVQSCYFCHLKFLSLFCKFYYWIY